MHGHLLSKITLRTTGVSPCVNAFLSYPSLDRRVSVVDLSIFRFELQNFEQGIMDIEVMENLLKLHNSIFNKKARFFLSQQHCHLTSPIKGKKFQGKSSL